MNKIQVAVLNEAHDNPAGMQLFLAMLTQRGEKINNMKDLMALYNRCIGARRAPENIRELAGMPHGTIKRFAPITIAIVGASRRFLAQARTHQVGIDYVSGSLQYSDYSDKAQFVVPYALMAHDAKTLKDGEAPRAVEYYLQNCNYSMQAYKNIAEATDNDTAGYAAPQGLRNILIMQGNHQSWDYFIRLRSCNRNTVETQYVTMLIWEALLNTTDGADLFAYAGPDCLHGKCREGKMTCGRHIMSGVTNVYENKMGHTLPRIIIDSKWPLLKEKY